ncbi:P-loop containing nucleoside triphosphate hydrolase protein [Sporormia fimetaria CBS 119925]|uniref:RNA helicase n=1 Tax=Sporormia fimetaria CBS 119925 TaxID=1340428 RepID=A0A6A6VDX7_9PLEO|nr:P-loop containing nucleoside triphosphate hydrolase protein [Sporormia fimetaria CBS 119925]
MLPSPSRRSSLCLLRATSALLRPPPLLPHVQKTYRSSRSRPDLPGSLSFRPRSGENVGEKLGPSLVPTVVYIALGKLRAELSDPEVLQSLALTRSRFDQEWKQFTKSVQLWHKRAAPEAVSLLGRRGSVQERMRHLFYAQIFGSQFTLAEIENQKAVADLRYPHEWYPATRAMSRTVHLHVGPTNSGKTYRALKRLEEANTGIYLGPLRLLAHEVYTRLNAKGKACALVTGEEQRFPEGETQMWSCTVEMAPLNQELDVAVIDEIQMIGNKDRGWAWTQAFLGLQAKEIHLCGEARTVPLMKDLCALVGDKVEVHEYERLTPLAVADKSLNGQLAKNLQKGDCIVSFSVLGIHALRKAVEKATGRKCAIVYGSLPPETRAQQARLFNDPDNEYDFLVASDAVGMGLNLSIKRVIFESVVKSNGQHMQPLSVSEVKQIAGRAGRYRTAHQAITQDLQDSSTVAPPSDPSSKIEAHQSPKDAKTLGYATTLEAFDFNYLKKCMSEEPEPITSAGLFPPAVVVERFSKYFPPATPFSYVMLRLHEMCSLHPRFHMCGLKDQLRIADALHPIKGLTIQDRLSICAAPTNVRDEDEMRVLQALAKCIAHGESGNLLDVPIPLEVLDETPVPGRPYLLQLEQLHKTLVLYLWLSYRFPFALTTRGLANYAKKLVEDAIEHALNEFNFTEASHARLQRKRQRALENHEQPKQKELPEALGDEATVGIPPVVLDVLKDVEAFEEPEPPVDDLETSHDRPFQ